MLAIENEVCRPQDIDVGGTPSGDDAEQRKLSMFLSVGCLLAAGSSSEATSIGDDVTGTQDASTG